MAVMFTADCGVEVMAWDQNMVVLLQYWYFITLTWW